jgi:hypothetical protein
MGVESSAIDLPETPPIKGAYVSTPRQIQPVNAVEPELEPGADIPGDKRRLPLSLRCLVQALRPPGTVKRGAD